MRIIIKNLSSKTTREKILHEFQKHGLITEISQPQQENRGFCFIGYANNESAQQAVKFHNRSYIDNKRITVEMLKKDDYKEKRQKLNELLGIKTEEDLYIRDTRITVRNVPGIATEADVKKVYVNVVSVVFREVLEMHKEIYKCKIENNKEKFKSRNKIEDESDLCSYENTKTYKKKDNALKNINRELKERSYKENRFNSGDRNSKMYKSFNRTQKDFLLKNNKENNAMKDGNINNKEEIDEIIYEADIVFKDIESCVEAQKIDIFMGRRVKYIEYTEKDVVKYYNSLFFDFKTVVERICEEERIKKEDLIDIKDNDLGIRIAILESHLVEQTRRWLEECKIDISQNGKISRKTLLIRNYDVANQLDGLEKARVRVSPSKCLAMAEFKNESEAAMAYKRFQLRRVNDSAIYCEYLPVKIDDISTEAIEKDLNIKEKTFYSKERKVEENGKISTNKIIIKNVPFQANVDEIRKILESQVKIKEIRMPIKRDGNKRGFCFVELENEESADFAIKYFGTSTHLYGRRLVIIKAES